MILNNTLLKEIIVIDKVLIFDKVTMVEFNFTTYVNNSTKLTINVSYFSITKPVLITFYASF